VVKYMGDTFLDLSCAKLYLTTTKFHFRLLMSTVTYPFGHYINLGKT